MKRTSEPEQIGKILGNDVFPRLLDQYEGRGEKVSMEEFRKEQVRAESLRKARMESERVEAVAADYYRARNHGTRRR